MTRTAPKKGAAGKFLALLASLTMIVAGLVGVAIASPAAAVSENSDTMDCQYLPAAPQGQSWVYLTTIQTGEVTSYEWTYAPGGVYAWVVKSSGNYNYQVFSAPQSGGTANSTSTNQNGETQNISHVSLCGLTTTPPDSGTVPGDSADYCVDDQDVTVSWPGATYGPDGDYETKEAAEAAVADGKKAAYEDAYEEYGITLQTPEGTCVPSSGNVLGGSQGYCANNVNGSVSWPSASFGREGNFPTEAEAIAEVEKGKAAALASIPAGTCGETVVETFSAPGGSDAFCSASGQTVTVTWDGVSGQGSQAQANEGAAFNKNNALNANGVPFGTEPGACAVAAAVALPATVVPAPTKKPVVVSAPKPAKVAGGVANIVSVPQAATVPAAVPAGDGSQAPGLPMWALALVAVGALGAAAAGKQILGARK